MAELVIPDYVRHNLLREEQQQNKMLQESQLKTAALQRGALSLRNQETMKQQMDRAELEQLLISTPEPDRDRVALEWAKVKDPEFRGKLEAMHIQRLQQTLGINPNQAVEQFKQSTGENLEYDPTSGIAQIDFGTSGKLAVNARGQMELIKPPTAAQQRGTVLPQGAGYIPPGAQEPTYTQPFKDTTEKDVKVGETITPKNIKIAKYKRPDGTTYDVEIGPARASTGVQEGLGRFVGWDPSGKPIAYTPTRGGAGRLTEVGGAAAQSGPLRPATTGFEERRAASNARSGLRAAATVREMLKDKNILLQAAVPGSPWARKFEAARKEMTDVITRLRTGAALNTDEEAFYKSQAPGVLDLTDPAAIEYKLKMFEDLFNDLATGGVGNTTPSPPSGGGAPPPGGGGGRPKILKIEKVQ